MSHYQEVMHEVTQRVKGLVQKDAHLTEAEALSAVFKADPGLYVKYSQASAEAPPPTVSTRTPATPTYPLGHTGAEAEAMQRAQALVAKSSARLSLADALSQVFKADPPLYQRYITKQDGPPAPSYADTLLSAQVDDLLPALHPYLSALFQTLRQIAGASSGDKPTQIARALADFTSAVTTRVHQELGLSAPTATAKRSPLIPAHLEAEVLKTMVALCGKDPLGKGALAVAKALAEVRTFWAERGAA
jgi:hypothetical protein